MDIIQIAKAAGFATYVNDEGREVLEEAFDFTVDLERFAVLCIAARVQDYALRPFDLTCPCCGSGTIGPTDTRWMECNHCKCRWERAARVPSTLALAPEAQAEQPAE